MTTPVTRKECTRETPFNPNDKLDGQWIHPSATDIGNNDDVATYHCPICGLTWKQKLP